MTRKKTRRSPGSFRRKRLGQHFLVDRSAIEWVVRVADVAPEEVVLEVGPGRGDLTMLLARKSRKVIAIEIDSTLTDRVIERAKPVGNVEVIHGDALKIDLEEIGRRTGKKLKIVANLPYRVSTPLLMRFLSLRHLFSSMFLMLQKEVALRIVAKPKTKDYGALSVFIQIHTTPTIELSLPPACFFPSPRVDSALVKFVIHEAPRVEIHSEKAFRQVVRAAFGHRRKTLKNALRSLLPEDRSVRDMERRLGDLHIDPKRRAETLSLDEFARLTAGLIPLLSSSEPVPAGLGREDLSSTKG
jgi:16S rRNA (adenine1518-N6/adenine1519-N6)-dimethyltransferase